MGRLTNSREMEEINEHALPIEGNLTPDKSKSAERVKSANAILTTLVRENTRLKNKELKKHKHTQKYFGTVAPFHSHATLLSKAMLQ